ncbi:MAG: AAA family ATPase [Arcobacteraceae bacterium]|jgi:DNA transposition AAA+ family ATPase|nr:AAA family ATPase [Arcobacteraceae bacterium]
MDLREEIRSFIESNGISQNRFAKTIGVNAAYLTGYMKEGESYKYAEKVKAPAQNYIANYIEKNSKKKDRDLEFVMTRDVKSIFAVIEWAVMDEDMAVISGHAGMGKSRAVREFTKNHPECLLIEATISTTARDLFKRIAELLGTNYKGSLDLTVRECASILQKSEKFIIIDEAEHLPYRALELLRRMYDFSRSPLVLVGTQKLIKNLTGGASSHNEYEQLSSRVGGKWILQGLSYPKEQDGKMVEIDDDLKAVCKLFGTDDASVAKTIKQYTKGNFRKTEKLLKRSQRLARSYGTKIDKEVIETAVEMLLLR